HFLGGGDFTGAAFAPFFGFFFSFFCELLPLPMMRTSVLESGRHPLDATASRRGRQATFPLSPVRSQPAHARSSFLTSPSFRSAAALAMPADGGMVPPASCLTRSTTSASDRGTVPGTEQLPVGRVRQSLPHTPVWRNELINRRALSSSAAAARRDPIAAMIDHPVRVVNGVLVPGWVERRSVTPAVAHRRPVVRTLRGQDSHRQTAG